MILSIKNLGIIETAEIELKGLTGIGENLDNFFEQTIYGYRKQK